MNKITSTPSPFRVLLLTVGSLILIITNVLLPVSGTTQSQDRIVTKFRKLAMPVEVKAIKTKKGSTKLGQAISDDDDWFDGLAISIENVSGKTIIYIGGGFLFPRPQETANGKPPRYQRFIYGRHPSVSGEDTLTSWPIEVRPGETFDIKLSKKDYDSNKLRLKQLGYPASIKEIKFNIEEIYFDDGTAWIAGGTFERDPNNPEQYKRVTTIPKSQKKRSRSSKQALDNSRNHVVARSMTVSLAHLVLAEPPLTAGEEKRRSDLSPAAKSATQNW